MPLGSDRQTGWAVHGQGRGGARGRGHVMTYARVLVSWSMVLIVVMVGACGGAAELAAEAPGTGRDRTADGGSEPGDQSLFEAAQEALRQDSTGRFVRKVWIESPRGKKSVFWRSEGRYDMSKRRTRGLATVIDPTGEDLPLQIQFASDARRVFLHAPAWRCWLAVGPDDDSAAAGIDPAPGGARPGEIAGLLRARTDHDRGNAKVIDATVPLRIVASLAGSYVYSRLSGKMSGIRVRARIHIKSGRLASWTVSGYDIMRELVYTKRLGKFVYSLQVLNFRVTLSDAGERLRVPIPPRSDWVEPSPGANGFDPNACRTGGQVI